MNNKRTGNHGEDVAAAALRLLGVQCVAKIATPHRRINKPPYIVYDEKVAGDHHGILPNGIGVLAESKTIAGGRLNYSELKPHQHKALQEWSSNGGLALVVWVSDFEVFVMEYYAAAEQGLRTRSSLSTSDAVLAQKQTRRIISNLLDMRFSKPVLSRKDKKT